MEHEKELEELKEAFGNLLKSMLSPKEQEAMDHGTDIVEKISEKYQVVADWAFGKDVFNGEGFSARELREAFEMLHPKLKTPTILTLKTGIDNDTFNLCLAVEISELYYTARG